jgi:hypothetical protein
MEQLPLKASIEQEMLLEILMTVRRIDKELDVLRNHPLAKIRSRARS